MTSFAVLTATFYSMALFSSGCAKYTLNYLRTCTDNSPCKVYSSIKVINGEQFITANFSCAIQVGDNLRSVNDIDLKVGNSFKHLFRISEKNLCYAANNYLGPLFTDMIRASGYYVTPPCPIPARTRLHLNNYKLDLGKMKVQSFPLGTLRATIRAIEKSSGRDAMCMEVELLATKS